MNKKSEHLKLQLFSEDWEAIKSAADQLFREGEFEYLIGLLQHKDSSIRAAAAITFRTNKFQDALEPLFDAINSKEYSNTNGTLVYTLETLNCTNKLSELFRILFSTHKNWEVQSHILTILDKQEFEFTNEELQSIKTSWLKIKNNWNDLNGIAEETRTKHSIDVDVVNESVQEFLVYLTTE
jgi:hypothetical protein